MIPGEHPVENPKHHVRQRQVIVRRCWEALEHASPVVRQIPGGATLKRWEFRHRCCRIWGKPVAHGRQCVAVEQAGDAANQIDTLSPIRFAADDGDGIGREEGVSAQACSASRAVEKQSVRQAAQALAAVRWVRTWIEFVDNHMQDGLTLWAVSRELGGPFCVSMAAST